MNPAAANLLLILVGGPSVMGGTFLVARALVNQHGAQTAEHIAKTHPARRPETTRPPQRRELVR